MIYLVDQDKIRRHNILTQVHSDYPCSTGDCKGTGKGLRVQQPPRRIDAEASSKEDKESGYRKQKRTRKHKT